MPGRPLAILDHAVAHRCAETLRTRPEWPCHAGCSDCCRSLADVPHLTEPEWSRVRDAIAALDDEARAHVEEALAERRALGDARPIVCPLLDTTAGLCRVYDARPLACRTHGFYADRDGVRGCHRILAISETDDAITWGNHDAVERDRNRLGESRSLLEWIDENDASTPR